MHSDQKKRSSTSSLNEDAADHAGSSLKRRRTIFSKSSLHKKIYSSDGLVEQMRPSKEELEYRKEQYKNNDVVKRYSKYFKCTKCQMEFKSMIKSHEKVPVHPYLGVLMCQKCCDYYLNGDFSVDSEGEEIYCRWCGEGGAILACSSCICGFCTNCIKKHWGIKYLNNIKKNDNWICFICDPKPLWKHRLICSVAVKESENENSLNSSQDAKNDCTTEKEETFNSAFSELSTSIDNIYEYSQKTENSFRKMTFSSSSEDETTLKKQKLSCSLSASTSDEIKDDFEPKKSDALIELGKVLKLTENHMNFGKAWVSKTLKKFTSPDYVATRKGLMNECQKIKQFLSLLSTFLVQFCNSVDSVDRSLQTDSELKKSFNTLKKDQASYSSIVQFLDFINNQVKLFMEKGISLSDILEPDIYYDGDIVGIKIKSNSSNVCSNQNGNTVNEDISIKSVNNMSTESKEAVDDENMDCEGKEAVDDENMDCEGKEAVDDENTDCEGKSKFESSPDILSSQDTETNFSKGSDEHVPPISSMSDINPTDPREEIQEILAILENA